MSSTEILTYQDAVEDLLDFFGEEHDRRAKRMAKRAVRDAYRFLAGRHDWSIYKYHGRISTVAPYSTGTITFDYTGGASERLVTLSVDGTFPSWTKYGVMTIDSRPYHIETNTGDNTATLTYSLNPGADLAAGTSYSLGRDTYPLPVNHKSLGALRDVVNGYVLEYINPEDWLEVIRGFTTTSCPTHYTVVGEPENYGSMAIKLAPMPDDAYVYDYIGDRSPSPLRTLDGATAAGTATTVGTALTVSAAALASYHAGSIIRFGDTTDAPTGFGGEHPYASQRVITSITNSTTAVLDSALTSNVTSVYYSLSDPLDIDASSMYSAMMADARLRFSRMTRLTGRDSGISLDDLVSTAWLEYLEAKAMDSRDTSDAYMGPRRAVPIEAANHPFIVSATED